MRLIRRFVPLVLFASVFATGVPLAPAGQMKVDVSTSSVQVTGANVTQQESHLLSRSVMSDDGKLRSANGSTIRSAPPGFRARVENPNHGQMVGFVWNGPVGASLEVRTQGSSGWTEWTPADSEDGPDPQQNVVKPGIGPLWIGDDAGTIEVRVVAGSLADLRVDTLHMDVQGNVNGIDSAGAAVAMPHIISRAEWGAAPWGTNTAGCGTAPANARARLAVVHHTDTSNGYSPAQAFGIVKSIQTFEIGSRGFCDMSYNFLVDRYGQIFEGRTNSVYQTPIGGHARGFNTGSIGVALIGQYQTGEPIPAASVPGVQYNALRDLLAWKFWWNGIDALSYDYTTSQCSSADGYPNCRWPEGTPVVLPAIVGHQDVTKTSCPGNLAEPLLPKLRADVAARVVTGGPFYPLDATRWQPAASGPAIATLDAYGGMHPAGAAGAVPLTGYWGWSIARGAVGTPAAGYVLDGWGGVRPYGSAPALAVSGYFTGWDIARALAVDSAGTGGYVLDGWGGLHQVGTAPPASAGYWYGWDIARDVALLPGGTGGYVLDGWGGVHTFGSAPPVTDEGYWYGWDIARSIALNPGGPGGYVLDGWGGVHAFGGAPAVGISNFDPTVNHTDLVMLPGGRGYVLDARGYVWQVGSAPAVDVSMTYNGYNIGRSLVASG